MVLFVTDSEFSDPPSDLDLMNLDIEDGTNDLSLTSSHGPYATNCSGSASALRNISTAPQVNSRFEDIPTEILNRIVAHLLNDADLMSLTCSCKTFANILAPEQSATWKERFLSRYDYPQVSQTVEYAFTYQLRRFVLRQYVEFSDAKDARLLVQMEVLRDMVVESYTPAQSHLLPPLTSKNLVAFASPHNAPWMCKFLSCFLFPERGSRFGQPFVLFDALQLLLSHLLLSPASKYAHIIKSSRANYDLAVVYSWDRDVQTLYQKSRETSAVATTPPRLLLTRNSRRMLPTPIMRPKPIYVLNLHALLHVRNFWHRLLIEEPRGFASTGIVENTYGKMAKSLLQAGYTPKRWEKPLKDDDLHIATEWFGHYSTLAQWPRKKQELEEAQSVAEDWEHVDPLKLDFDISFNNEEDGFWAPIFRDIPVFRDTVNLDPGSCIFLRGLAPFVELSVDKKINAPVSGSQATLTVPTTPQLPKYHPYLAMRMRGVVHSITAQPQATGPDGRDWSIPGWNRIVMILYRPSKRHLIQVLEHAAEEFGDTFTTAITTQMTQNGTTTTQAAQLLNGTGAAGQALDPAELDRQLDAHLRNKLLSSDLWRDGSKMTKVAIEEMEEKFRLSEYLDWNDIDYAYAYEGVILPGGKIMMGRYWRLAMNGEGDHMEWSDMLGDMDVADDDGSGNSDGMNLDHDNITVAEGGNETETGESASGNNAAAGSERSRYKKLERGPFVFWC